MPVGSSWRQQTRRIIYEFKKMHGSNILIENRIGERCRMDDNSWRKVAG